MEPNSLNGPETSASPLIAQGFSSNSVGLPGFSTNALIEQQTLLLKMFSEQLGNVQAQLRAQTQEVSELKAQTNQLNQTVTEFQARNQQLEQKCDELHRQNRQLSQKVDSHHDEIGDINISINLLNGRLDELKQLKEEMKTTPVRKRVEGLEQKLYPADQKVYEQCQQLRDQLKSGSLVLDSAKFKFAKEMAWYPLYEVFCDQFGKTPVTRFNKGWKRAVEFSGNCGKGVVPLKGFSYKQI